MGKNLKMNIYIYIGFPSSSAGKESTCYAGDPGSIPGLGRSAGEGIGYPLQYSWASLEGQRVKNRPAMQETWVQSLGWEDTFQYSGLYIYNILPEINTTLQIKYIFKKWL